MATARIMDNGVLCAMHTHLRFPHRAATVRLRGFSRRNHNRRPETAAQHFTIFNFTFSPPCLGGWISTSSFAPLPFDSPPNRLCIAGPLETVCVARLPPRPKTHWTVTGNYFRHERDTVASLRGGTGMTPGRKKTWNASRVLAGALWGQSEVYTLCNNDGSETKKTVPYVCAELHMHLRGGGGSFFRFRPWRTPVPLSRSGWFFTVLHVCGIYKSETNVHRVILF